LVVSFSSSLPKATLIFAAYVADRGAADFRRSCRAWRRR
jgi:hypothetical protein